MTYASTVADVKQAFVTLLAAALEDVTILGSPVDVKYSWTGDTTPVAVYLTRPALDDGDRAEYPHALSTPVMQPGAQPYDERYRIDLTMWAFRGDGEHDDLYTAEKAVCDLSGYVLAVLNAAPNLGVAGVQFSMPSEGTAEPRPFQSGHVVVRVIPIDITARLNPS